jgi:hypothetical protein
MIPGRAIPDLHAAPDPDNRDVARYSGVLSQECGDDDTSLAVKIARNRAAKECPGAQTRLGTKILEIVGSLSETLPLRSRIDAQTVVEATSHHSAMSQTVAQLARYREPALVVYSSVILAEKHVVAFRH